MKQCTCSRSARDSDSSPSSAGGSSCSCCCCWGQGASSSSVVARLALALALCILCVDQHADDEHWVMGLECWEVHVHERAHDLNGTDRVWKRCQCPWHTSSPQLVRNLVAHSRHDGARRLRPGVRAPDQVLPLQGVTGGCLQTYSQLRASVTSNEESRCIKPHKRSMDRLSKAGRKGHQFRSSKTRELTRGDVSRLSTSAAGCTAKEAAASAAPRADDVSLL